MVFQKGFHLRNPEHKHTKMLESGKVLLYQMFSSMSLAFESQSPKSKSNELSTSYNKIWVRTDVIKLQLTQTGFTFDELKVRTLWFHLVQFGPTWHIQPILSIKISLLRQITTSWFLGFWIRYAWYDPNWTYFEKLIRFQVVKKVFKKFLRKYMRGSTDFCTAKWQDYNDISQKSIFSEHYDTSTTRSSSS